MESDFLGMQLAEDEQRAAEAKDRLRIGATPVVERREKRPEHPSTPISDTDGPEEPDGGKTTQEASGGSQKDRRRVNRRRKPHTVTMLDDDWAEMVDAAGRHGIGVSEMLVELWHKRGRKLYG